MMMIYALPASALRSFRRSPSLADLSWRLKLEFGSVLTRVSRSPYYTCTATVPYKYRTRNSAEKSWCLADKGNPAIPSAHFFCSTRRMHAVALARSGSCLSEKRQADSLVMPCLCIVSYITRLASIIACKKKKKSGRITMGADNRRVRKYAAPSSK
jgi:hypothetical protein